MCKYRAYQLCINLCKQFIFLPLSNFLQSFIIYFNQLYFTKIKYSMFLAFFYFAAIVTSSRQGNILNIALYCVKEILWQCASVVSHYRKKIFVCKLSSKDVILTNFWHCRLITEILLCINFNQPITFNIFFLLNKLAL